MPTLQVTEVSATWEPELSAPDSGRVPGGPHSTPFLGDWEVNLWVLIEVKFHLKLEPLTIFRKQQFQSLELWAY